MRFYIDNLGCHLRSHDTEVLKNYLLNNNLILTDDYDSAEYVILTGCLSDKFMSDNSNKRIKEHVAKNKKLVLTGCISKNIVEEYSDILHVPPQKLEGIEKLLSDVRRPYAGIPKNNKILQSESSKIYYQNIKKYTYNLTFFRKFFRDIKTGVLFKKRPLDSLRFIQIGTGCAFNCSFCNTKFCFDGVKSKPQEIILNEYQSLVKQGAKEVVFISEDIGSYGTDLNTNLFDMLLMLSEADKNKSLKWHLDAINPYWSIKYENKLLSLVKSKRIKSIVFTIQSANSRILNLMNRYDNTHKIEENIKKIKKAHTSMRMSGFFMVGFPSESKQEFEDTLSFIKRIKFDDVFMSCYSEFEHCASAKILPKVPENEIIERYNIAKNHLSKYNIFCKN